ncbi:DUF6115 domain-containing protein [Pseudalkalibacillus berkeleyi]|uniref:Swarming motility protein SwrB n=1 Tax=Pseudalkalibacillus berkeleyi TaxID=1069813 RepID=A0ABS9GWH6_9BACL|nr:hypothetical protein [Pseudalkalibacillus berkeleyi]MCF6137134.1 hypothetical protein [Pseudalkalibacillus berkeleyi]
MTGFILGISFVIHIITLLSLIVLWKRYQANDHQEIQRAKKEMEDILVAYTTEMKEENDAFLLELRQVANQSPKPHDGQTDITLNKQNENEEQVNDKPAAAQTEDTIDYAPPINYEEETYGPSLISQVLSLQGRGLSLDEIAKSLNKGKGEIELMIKFHQDGQ